MSDQQMLGWALNEIYGKRLCRMSWRYLVDWSLNLPKVSGGK